VSEPSTLRAVHDLTDGERELLAGRPVSLPERPAVDWVRHKGDGRPKILPPPGETWRNPATNRKVGHRYYTRVTTFADAITESYNLTAWKLRRLLKGAANRRDYVIAAAGLTLEDRDRDAFDELVGLVLEAAGESASLLGTTLHSLFEALDRGEDLGVVPDEVQADLAAYVALTEGSLRHAFREPRTVCDQLECGGTPDMVSHVLVEPCPAGCGPEVLHIGDSKTGSIRYPGKMSTQLAIYSRSKRYDPQTGERLEWPAEVCQRWGFIVHSPVETGEAALFWLDLEHGWRGAELCGPVRQWHRAHADDILRPFETVQPVRVRDGEVTRFEPRLASWNPKSPTERPADPADITDALAPAPASMAEVLEDAALDARDRADAEAARVAGGVVVELPAEPDSCDVRVVGTGDAGEPVHWCADHDSAWPHETPDERTARYAEVNAGIEAAGIAVVPDAEPGRCTELESSDPGAPRCELRAGHTCGHGFERTPTPIERCVHELRLGECAMPACRPDLAHLDDTGVEREQLTEVVVDLDSMRDAFDEPVADAVHRGIVGAEADRPAPWPGVDDVPIEQLASGPDSDAEDADANGCPDAAHLAVDCPGDACRHAAEPEADPIADAIRACVTTRDLELLSSTAWRSWGPEHRKLAAEVHDRLEAAERAARPRAAFEAAISAAKSVAEVEAVVAAATGQPWLDEFSLEVAGQRWRELRSVPA